MKNKILIKFFTLTGLGFIIAAIVYGGYAIVHTTFQISATAAASSGISGNLQIEVIDGVTKMPIENASIIIPETAQHLLTASDGKTEVVQIPVMQNTAYREILPMPWGEITLLTYKEGYIPYALFHTQIWPNTLREGPQILLFPLDSSENAQPFSIIEGPQRDWVNELMEKYRPSAAN